MEKGNANIFNNQVQDFTSALADKSVNLGAKAFSANSENHNCVNAAYQKVINDIGLMTDRENCKVEDRQWYIEKEIQVADKMANKDSENKTFISRIVDKVQPVCIVVAFSLGILFGIHYGRK